MTTKPKQLVTLEDRDGIEMIKFELPAYAVRYLKQMCKRERTFLTNVNATGSFETIIDSAFDALGQIEQAINEQ